MVGKTSRSEILWTTRGILTLQTLKASCPSDMHSRFYECSKLKKWMCELRMHVFANPVTYVCYAHTVPC